MHSLTYLNNLILFNRAVIFLVFKFYLTFLKFVFLKILYLLFFGIVVDFAILYLGVRFCISLF